MITYLNGTITEKQPTRVVLDLGGVGYEVFIPLSSFDRLPAENETCRLLVHDYIREDQHALYGFFTDTERRIFLLLLTISGIGPKLALSVLSGLSIGELIAAIGGSDVKRLGCVPGIGKKMSERIVVELRDKIAAMGFPEATGGDVGPAGESAEVRDAVLALVSLGYKQAEAAKMVRIAVEADPSMKDVEGIIRKVLAR